MQRRLITSHFTSVGAEHVWVWTTDQQDELFFDLEETVRFRVEAEVWTDQSPQAPTTDDTPIERKSPYRIIVSGRNLLLQMRYTDATRLQWHRQVLALPCGGTKAKWRRSKYVGDDCYGCRTMPYINSDDPPSANKLQSPFLIPLIPGRDKALLQRKALKENRPAG